MRLHPLVLAGLVVAGPSTAAAQSRLPLTAPERTQYRETTRYDEVMRFLEAVDRASPRLHQTTFGYTTEGRALPLVVAGARDASPAAVRATGRLRVFIQANIHAGEVEGKEAMLVLLRDLAQGRHLQWLDSLVLLVAPIYNADGNERVALTNRPLQHGPVGGMGQRPNAQGLDLNRDHTKLESPEARALAALFTAYDPHVVIDLHTTNGTYHAYHLTYSPPLHPGTDSSLVQLLRERLLPVVAETLRGRDSLLTYYYGNAPGGAGISPRVERGWYTFDHRPRFNNNYVGLRNRFAVLSEAYAYLSFDERVRATRRFVEGLLDGLRQDASRYRSATAALDRRSIVGASLPLRATYQRGDTIEILMGEVEEGRHPFTGRRVLRRRDVVRSERMPDYASFVGTDRERVPAAYLLLPPLDSLAARLEAHGIRTERLLRSRVLAGLERYRVDSSWVAGQEFQGHRERTVQGAWEAATDSVPAGAVVVPMDQPLARLAFYLLEPRSDDGFLNWNLFDAVLAAAGTGPRRLPLLRVHGAW